MFVNAVALKFFNGMPSFQVISSNRYGSLRSSYLLTVSAHPQLTEIFANVCTDLSPVLYPCFLSSLLRCRDLKSCLVTLVEVLSVG